MQADVEDDFHCMSVTVRHSNGVATQIEAVMQRAPWTTCPGAVRQLQATFSGVALAAFAERGEKRENCTHLHDLATLAATHARGQLLHLSAGPPERGQAHRRNQGFQQGVGAAAGAAAGRILKIDHRDCRQENSHEYERHGAHQRR
ncbi:DUF2889 domain-containing protein [Povalibacter sp.]|uniref:DUF2889 domain-containing protein n=1 Tax=Povalibacter sp. TaxID=1962978 RepID=UPI002D1F9F25|nr:DUF2889 domain-containing protein [Povalibacter sp.]